MISRATWSEDRPEVIKNMCVNLKPLARSRMDVPDADPVCFGHKLAADFADAGAV